MRVLIVSDVHANLVAFDAVIEDAGSVEMIWSLGDIVGYGPEPNACIERLREFDHIAIPGNHDWGVLGKLDLSDFNAFARAANLWTRDQLTETSREYLESLPEVAVCGDFSMAHGSPRSPIWEYLLYADMAQPSFDFFETSVCFVGHTHVPVIFRDVRDTGAWPTLAIHEGVPFELDGRERYIINPGGVGQPRDGNPKASYAILDTTARRVTHHRVEYDIWITQGRILDLGLPASLANRLLWGR